MGLSDQATYASELLYEKSSFFKENSMSSTFQVPVQLTSFSIDKLLGRGSYAKVFLVTKKDSGEQYAMKVLK